MHITKNIFFSIIFLSIISCNTQEDEVTFTTRGTLIFGHFYGECLGEACVETFKLDDNNLYEDTEDNYSALKFNFVQLSNAKYLNVKDLKSKIPTQLLTIPDSTFGCPDCADGGGLFIQYDDNITKKTWRIDKQQNNVPVFLHNFMDEVEAKIKYLQ